jgi:hypothetical protein
VSSAVVELPWEQCCWCMDASRSDWMSCPSGCSIGPLALQQGDLQQGTPFSQNIHIESHMTNSAGYALSRVCSVPPRCRGISMSPLEVTYERKCLRVSESKSSISNIAYMRGPALYSRIFGVLLRTLLDACNYSTFEKD